MLWFFYALFCGKQAFQNHNNILPYPCLNLCYFCSWSANKTSFFY